MTHDAATPCIKCGATARPMELTDDGPLCLMPCSGRRPHLVLVSPEPSELESLLMASLADRGRLLNATHNALERVES